MRALQVQQNKIEGWCACAWDSRIHGCLCYSHQTCNQEHNPRDYSHLFLFQVLTFNFLSRGSTLTDNVGGGFFAIQSH